jgi:hypothetical protein
MITRLTAALLCMSLLLAITPLDQALGTPCPGASTADHAPAVAETCPDEDPAGHSCPDDCQCLCCPGARILDSRSRAPRLAPPQASPCDAPSPKACAPGDFVDTIFHPPRHA